MVDVHWYHGMKLSDVERLVIIRAYSFYGRNKTKTAEGLGISIRTLDGRLEEYGLKATPEGNEHLMEIVKKRSRKPRVTKPRAPKSYSPKPETVKKVLDAHKHLDSPTPRLEPNSMAPPLAEAVTKFMTYGPK